MSPDGSAVVFEVTDDHSILLPAAPEGLVPAEDEGFFVVNADGTGLRRLGDASRDPCWRLGPTPDSFTGTGGPTHCWRLWFSPDGRKVAFTDIGPDETGQEGPQVFTMDVATGARTQVTRLAPLVPPGPLVISLRMSRWTEDGSAVRFDTTTETDGYHRWSVRADGTEEPREIPARERPEPLPGATLESIPRITDAATNVIRRGSDGVSELWVVSQEDPLNPGSIEEELQLTSFGRPDTGVPGRFLDVEQQTVLFFASADPFGTNPTQNCQLFSIDTLGGNLRQVTRWNQTQRLPAGCTVTPQPPPDCYIEGFEVDRRAGPDTLLFSTSCDPLGTNPLSDNLYAVRTDGTGLRQLTHSRGLSLHDDGSVTVELTGNWAASR